MSRRLIKKICQLLLLLNSICFLIWIHVHFLLQICLFVKLGFKANIKDEESCTVTVHTVITKVKDVACSNCHHYSLQHVSIISNNVVSQGSDSFGLYCNIFQYWPTWVSQMKRGGDKVWLIIKDWPLNCVIMAISRYKKNYCEQQTKVSNTSVNNFFIFVFMIRGNEHFYLLLYL